MAKLGDDIERYLDESMPFYCELLGDTSAAKRGLLTLAQCTLLMPAILTYKKPCDATQMAVHYLRMAFLDMEDGELDPKHPETLLPYSQYLRMSERGVFGSDGADMPFPNGGWLITFAEAERWLESKDIHVNFDGVRADLEEMRTDGLDTWPDGSAQAEQESTEPSVALPEMTSSSVDVAAREITRQRIKWDENRLRHLYSESIAPGATPAKLAVKYGVSRQGIAKQIKAAEQLCRVGRRPNAASVAWKAGK